MKVVIYGLGRDANNLFDWLERLTSFDEKSIVAVCDSNKVGGRFRDRPVKSINEISSEEFEYLVISSSHYFEEIKAYLLNHHYCTTEKIINLNEYRKMIFSEKVYVDRYGRTNDVITRKKKKVDKLIVYTSITGCYDSLKDPIFVDDKITYICFTDNKDLKSDIWNIRSIDIIDSDPRLSAKKVKICPWEYINCNGPICWVDGKFLIKDDLREYYNHYNRGNAILCFPHFERTTICDETAELIKCKPEIKKELIIQSAHYLNSGFKDDYGLYECGCIIRDFSFPIMKKLMMDWWSEIEQYTIRDQISFPYVCWKNEVLPDICNLYIENNNWLQYYSHNTV